MGAKCRSAGGWLAGRPPPPQPRISRAGAKPPSQPALTPDRPCESSRGTAMWPGREGRPRPSPCGRSAESTLPEGISWACAPVGADPQPGPAAEIPTAATSRPWLLGHGASKTKEGPSSTLPPRSFSLVIISNGPGFPHHPIPDEKYFSVKNVLLCKGKSAFRP